MAPSGPRRFHGGRYRLGMALRRHTVSAVLLTVLLSACTGDDAVAEVEPPPSTAAPAPTTTSSTQPPVVAPPVVGADVLASLPGQLVVATDEGAIEIIDPNGEGRRSIDDRANTLLSQPTWAPGGTRLSWTSITAAGPAVRVHDLTDSATTDIPTDTPAFYHSWNAAGDQVATLRSSGTGPIQLDIHDADTGTTREIALGQPFYLDWADEGDRVVVAVNANAVARVDLDDASGANLQLPAPVGVFQSPAVLSDESFLISLAAANGFELVQIDSSDMIRRIARLDGAISMATSPDSSRVAVLVSPDPSAPQLEQASFQTLEELPDGLVSIIDLAAGTVDTLPHPNVVAINWSPDGSWLAALQIDAAGSRWLFTRNGVTTRGPNHEPTPTMLQQYLPFADQYNQSHRWWSPDSRAFVFAGSVAGEDGVWIDVVDDDADPAKIADGGVAFWSPS